MNTTTRTIAALGVTGALVAGGAAAATGTSGDDTREATDSARSEVEQLVHDAVQDGTVTIEEEDAIKQAIEEHSGLEFESLDEVASNG